MVKTNLQQGYQQYKMGEGESSTNGAGNNEYPRAKEWNWTLILGHTQKSIRNDPST